MTNEPNEANKTQTYIDLGLYSKEQGKKVMLQHYNDALNKIAHEMNYLEREFYVNMAIMLNDEYVYPQLVHAPSGKKLIEFNGDEWVAHEQESTDNG